MKKKEYAKILLEIECIIFVVIFSGSQQLKSESHNPYHKSDNQSTKRQEYI